MDKTEVQSEVPRWNAEDVVGADRQLSHMLYRRHGARVGWMAVVRRDGWGIGRRDGRCRSKVGIFMGDDSAAGRAMHL